MKYIKLFNEAKRIKVSNEFFERITYAEFTKNKKNHVDFNDKQVISLLQENQYDDSITKRGYQKVYIIHYTTKNHLVQRRNDYTGYGFEERNYGRQKLTVYSNSIDYIDIYEGKDEWFYVVERDSMKNKAWGKGSRSSKYYQCDQYDGLVELLKYLKFI